MDTTATSTLAAYDRIIVVGEQLQNSVIPGTAGVLRFDEQMSLGEEELLKVILPLLFVTPQGALGAFKLVKSPIHPPTYSF